jgi:hypothetical protein
MGAESFYAEGLTHRRTDKQEADSKTTRLKVAFCNFAKELKNENCFLKNFTFVLLKDK